MANETIYVTAIPSDPKSCDDDALGISGKKTMFVPFVVFFFITWIPAHIENLRHFRTEPLFLSSYLSLERKPQVWHLLNNHMVKFAVSVKAAVKNYTHWFCFRTIRWAPKATKLYDVEYTNIFHNNTHSRVVKIDLILRI